jgi:hypothetical protein
VTIATGVTQPIRDGDAAGTHRRRRDAVGASA